MSKIPGEKIPLRAEAEAKLAQARKPEIPGRTGQELLHELQVYQIELEMQNETLRQTQTALEESRDRFMNLYEFAPVGYLTLTEAGLIAEMNLTCAALLGRERRKLLNSSFARLVAPGDQERWNRLFSEVLRKGVQQHAELVLQRGDGSRFDGQLDYLRIEADNAFSVRITLTDITEQKRIEEDLRIAAIAFQSQEGIMVTDANSIILRVNEAFTRITGYSAEEAIGKTPALLHSGLQDKRFYELMRRDMNQQHYWQGEMWNKRKDGNIYPEWQTISAVLAPDGSVSHFISTFLDISERKIMEKEIMERREKMAELQILQIMTQTAAAIAHELNQPLMAITSYSNATRILLQSEKPDLDEVRKAIEASERQALRAGESIRNLLDFLSMKEFPSEAFDLNQEILGVLDTARSEHELNFHTILRLDEVLLLVRANRTHIQKVLLNLLHNGIEAMQEAGVPLPSITVVVSTKKDTGVAQVTIQDNGPGIKEHDLRRLFEPFFTTKPAGIGMGLSVSRSLIEANGGQLWIDPQERPGATFHFTLPLAT